MAEKLPTPKTIDAYIATLPVNVQLLLEELRDTIKQVAPGAGETISYQIPTFTLNGNLVHFAGFKNHIGFYPTPTAIREFKSDLVGFEWAKGSIKFPIDKPLPLELVRKMVAFRVKENMEKVKNKIDGNEN
jgi:uncharacterized protein YdhG (YjbR/CyaY superfamily)